MSVFSRGTDRPEVHAGVEDVDLTGTTALVTGGTDGIGREAAAALARLGATVLVTGRDGAKGEAVEAELAASGDGEARFYAADFADLDAVGDLADSVAAEHDALDLLVNNAGAIFREASLTPDGVERTMAVNYLAHFVLTRGCYDLLRAAPDGRVVNVSSNGHRFADWEPAALESLEDYGAFGAYNRSKLALLMFSNELAARSDAVRSNGLHPGFVPDSGFYRGFPSVFRRLLPLLLYVPRAVIRRPVVTSAEAAGGVVYVAVSPDTASATGRYYEEYEPIRPADVALDAGARRELWDRSEALSGVEWDP